MASVNKYTTYTSKYSLADYIVTLEIPAVGNLESETFSIGGLGDNNEGSCVGEISIARSANLFETSGDATGSWVHNKNLDKTGTVSISIRQVSNYIIKLIMICNAYESLQSHADGITITVTPVFANGSNSPIAICNDCFIQKIPDQSFAAQAAEQSWVFTCGQIKYSPTL